MGSAVLATCRRILLNAHEGEDAAQECFVEVQLSVRTFSEAASQNTWVLQIATRKSLDLLRKGRSRSRLGRWFMPLEAAPLASITRLVGLGADRSEDPLDQDRKLSLLLETLDKLSRASGWR